MGEILKERLLYCTLTKTCCLFQVDFQLMEIVRPSRQPIRRSFTPGVSLEYIASPNEMSFFAKINSVQVRIVKAILPNYDRELEK